VGGTDRPRIDRAVVAAAAVWVRARVRDARGTDPTDDLLALTGGLFAEAPVLQVLIARDAAESAVRHGRPEAEAAAARADELLRAFDAFGTLGDLRVGGDAATAGSARADGPFAMLSEREAAVAALAVDGMSYAQSRPSCA
jgi:hypothetical protein